MFIYEKSLIISLIQTTPFVPLRWERNPHLNREKTRTDQDGLSWIWPWNLEVVRIRNLGTPNTLNLEFWNLEVVKTRNLWFPNALKTIKSWNSEPQKPWILNYNNTITVSRTNLENLIFSLNYFCFFVVCGWSKWTFYSL